MSLSVFLFITTVASDVLGRTRAWSQMIQEWHGKIDDDNFTKGSLVPFTEKVGSASDIRVRIERSENTLVEGSDEKILRSFDFSGPSSVVCKCGVAGGVCNSSYIDRLDDVTYHNICVKIRTLTGCNSLEKFNIPYGDTCRQCAWTFSGTCEPALCGCPTITE